MTPAERARLVERLDADDDVRLLDALAADIRLNEREQLAVRRAVAALRDPDRAPAYMGSQRWTSDPDVVRFPPELGHEEGVDSDGPVVTVTAVDPATGVITLGGDR